MPGYDKSRFKNLTKNESDHLICGICLAILCNPKITGCCDQAYCQECIYTWLVDNNTCPNDRNILTNNGLSNVNKLVKNMLFAMEIYCQFKSNGCKEAILLEFIDAHEKKCKFNPKHNLEMWPQVLESLKTIDKKISHSMYSIGCQRMPAHYRSYLEALEYSCHGIAWFAITIIILYLSQNNKVFGELLVGLLLDVIYVALLKASTRRRRPQYAKRDDQFLVVSVDKHSLPSGHASRAIYVAIFFSNHSLISPLMWFWSFAVCISGIVLGRHHVFDVLCGIIVGYLNFLTQFTIFYPIKVILLWSISAILKTTFSNNNDFV